MRSIGVIIAAAGLCLASPAAAGFGFPLRVEGVGRLGSTGPIYLLVEGGGSKQGVLRIDCVAERVADAHFQPDVRGSSKASAGEHRRKLEAIPKKWRPPGPRLRTMRPILPAALLSTPADAAGWVRIGLASVEELCPASEQSLKKANKP